MKKQKTIIKETIEKILEKMSVQGVVEVFEKVDEIQFVVKSNEFGTLVGENGKNFIALSCLVKQIAEKKIETENLENLPFFFDINDYQTKKVEELKSLAKMNAQRVRHFKKEVEMPPMNSYERRVIHAVLTEDADVLTESTGEGRERRIVIKPNI